MLSPFIVKVSILGYFPLHLAYHHKTPIYIYIYIYIGIPHEINKAIFKSESTETT